MKPASLPLALLLLTAVLPFTTADEFAPFPQNRVRDFYSRQAEHFMAAKEPLPDVLPQFPGLDGGAFGHWGQNPSENSVDTSLNHIDSGNIICSHVKHFGKNTHKGVAIRLHEDPTNPAASIGAVFDPLKLTFTDSWSGGFVARGSNRFGVHDGASAIGKRLFDFTAGGWIVPEDTAKKYVGFYRHGKDVVFAYRLGDATVYDRLWALDGVLIRSLQIDGQLPPFAKLTLMKADAMGEPITGREFTHANFTSSAGPVSIGIHHNASTPILRNKDGRAILDFRKQSADDTVHIQFHSSDAKPLTALSNSKVKADHSPKTFVQPAPGQWTGRTATTAGELGNNSDAFAIDTVTIPYATANPFGTPMRLAGVGSLGDGRMVLSTLLGDVWIVSGVDESMKQLTWQRIAAGLYQPLGLVVQDGKIILGGNDQITRLHDNNGDGEADFYECLTNDYPTTGGHDFATSLQQDDQGRLYWATASRDFGLTRLDENGEVKSLGNGLRNSNGIGVSPDGSITLATVQEGSWAPATAIFNVGDGSFHGHRGPQKNRGKFGYDLPQCFVPRGVDNSAGEIVFLPDDRRLGPLAGKAVGSSYGYGQHYLVLREELNGMVQGGIVPLPGEFNTGACRWSFNQNDGNLYVAGTEGWQSYGRENGGLQRLRFTGRHLPLPIDFETRHNGLIIHCNTQISSESVTKANVFCQQWNYLFSGGYGSPEYSVKDEGRQGHDPVEVKSVHLLPNGKSVFLEIPQLHPVMQFHVHMKLKTADGQAFNPDAYLTLYELGDAFTDFPDYQNIAKRPWPEFPRAEEYTQDPRLVEQDKFGTNFGWVSSAKKITLNATTGLQYEPKRLRVAPGSRVALTFHNTDPGMPHNVVVVKADQLNKIGEQAMMLASNPRAIATHYVPNDPAEICFSPILNPGDQYTVYFEAPMQPGRYRFLCTYPGHWKVMQGSLHILPDDQPLPEPSPDEITRQFVKRWLTSDFANDANDLSNRNRTNGERVFTLAGCIKCHKVGNKGTKLGPELTDISKRFQGTKLLQQILQPSVEINKDFQTWVAILTNGKVATGLLTERTASQITLLPNPLQPNEKVTLPTDQIDELTPSEMSTMPEGLLMTFSKEEILDLLAFLEQQSKP